MPTDSSGSRNLMRPARSKPASGRLDFREYERLLRRAFSYPKQPAVVLVHMFKQW